MFVLFSKISTVFLVNLIDFMNSRMLSIPIKNECMNLYFDTVS